MACQPENHLREIKTSPRRGVIDIGSNGIRLLIGAMDTQGKIKKIFKKRKSIRLGQDAFTKNIISPPLIDQVIEAMYQFNKEFRKAHVQQIRAVATSAVREAKNKEDFISQVFKKTGISIEVIDSFQESQFILSAVQNQLSLTGSFPSPQRSSESQPLQNRNETGSSHRLLVIDIGGGSVEFIFHSPHTPLHSVTLPLGTVRMFKYIQSEKDRNQLAKQYDLALSHVKHLLQPLPEDTLLVGTGGNFECLLHLKRKFFQEAFEDRVRFHELASIMDRLFALNFEDRIHKFNLKVDRADVILPASLLIYKILQLTQHNHITIPQVGLREGLLISLFLKDPPL